MKKLIEHLTIFAVNNGWSHSMFDIVENDIKQGKYTTVEALDKYIKS